jgi:hypothetical protein
MDRQIEVVKQRLAALKTGCDGWIQRWVEVKANVAMVSPAAIPGRCEAAPRMCASGR